MKDLSAEEIRQLVAELNAGTYRLIKDSQTQKTPPKNEPKNPESQKRA